MKFNIFTNETFMNTNAKRSSDLKCTNSQLVRT